MSAIGLFDLLRQFTNRIVQRFISSLTSFVVLDRGQEIELGKLQQDFVSPMLELVRGEDLQLADDSQHSILAFFQVSQLLFEIGKAFVKVIKLAVTVLDELLLFIGQ